VFAGGFIGALAKSADFSAQSVRRAIVYGSVMASFVVEKFSFDRLRELTDEDVEHRYRQFVALTEF
jgi:hypothetical protein